MNVKQVARRNLDRLLRRRGLMIVEVPKNQRTGWLVDISDTSTALPPGAEEYLRADNPRLRELREEYAKLDWPVTVRGRWTDDVVDPWLVLHYFRGDTPYVWQYREPDRRYAMLKFFAFLRYVLDHDPNSLVERLGEDGAFGCFTYRFPGYPPVSRDLLDAVDEISFLEEETKILSSDGLRILDIGAGYGRLAHRIGTAVSTLGAYACVDAIPQSTFLCEYYMRYRGLVPPVSVVPLPEVPALQPGAFDIAFNVHSFSECPREAIAWWMEQLVRLRVPRLFLVPNEAEGFLSTEADGSRLDYEDLITGAGYRSIATRRKFTDEAVRELIDIHDRYCLFERT